MLVERLHHVGISVRDLDEALAFYCGVMGFTTDPSRPDFGIDGAWIDCGPTQIHLLVSDDPAPNANRHFALRVDDLDAWEAHLQANGAPTRRLKYFHGAGRQLFVQDPSGNAFELNQPDAS